MTPAARADATVNAARVELYVRLMRAEDRIARDRYARGVSDAMVMGAIDAAELELSEDERREDLFLASLALYVEALGGRLELHAVFEDGTTVIEREPSPPRVAPGAVHGQTDPAPARAGGNALNRLMR